MKSLHEKKVSMYHKIHELFETHLTTLAANASSLTSRVNGFNSKLSLLYNTYKKVNEKDLAYEIQKLSCHHDLRERAIVIAGGLKAYALSLKSNVLSEKAHLTKTMLDHTKDVEMLDNCEHLFDLANNNATAILPFGVTPIKLHAFKTSINQFRYFIHKDSDNGMQNSVAGKEADLLMQEIDNILESIDGIIDTQKEDFPAIYDQYYNHRGPYIHQSSDIPKAVRNSLDKTYFQSVYTNPMLIAANNRETGTL
ncbi:MAG: hypothetical protein V4613_07515 [Bacteroidota bacterium]